MAKETNLEDTAAQEEESKKESLVQGSKSTVVTDKSISFAKAGKRSAKAIKEAAEKQAKEERKKRASETNTELKPKQVIRPPRSKLERRSKSYRKSAELIDKTKEYSLNEALELAQKTSNVKFDASVELHINLNVDPKQADQNIRGTVLLPAGTGKTVRVAIADENLLAKLDKGTIDFDVLIATPEFMPKLGKYAKLLGPRGLMPNPKSGTVTTNIKKTVEEAKAGRVEYRIDSTGIVHVAFGKLSFGTEKLAKNARAIIESIKSAKPASIKGLYIKSIYIATTMGPSIKLKIE